jgi:hypothetical protein
LQVQTFQHAAANTYACTVYGSSNTANPTNACSNPTNACSSPTNETTDAAATNVDMRRWEDCETNE